MIDITEFSAIAPAVRGKMRYSNEYYQGYDLFQERFKAFFPKFPDQVIRQWPYENFECFTGEYRWLIEYDRLEFGKSKLNVSDFKVLAAERFDNKELLEMGQTHLNDNEYVARYIREHLTYPVPIIVLDSLASNLDGDYEFSSPYHILEGHRRSWLMRALVETGNPCIPKTHEVWMAIRK